MRKRPLKAQRLKARWILLLQPSWGAGVTEDVESTAGAGTLATAAGPILEVTICSPIQAKGGARVCQSVICW